MFEFDSKSMKANFELIKRCSIKMNCDSYVAFMFYTTMGSNNPMLWLHTIHEFQAVLFTYIFRVQIWGHGVGHIEYALLNNIK